MTTKGGVTAEQAARAIVAASMLLGVDPARAYEKGPARGKGAGRSSKAGRCVRVLAALGVRARLGLPSGALAKEFDLFPQELSPSTARRYGFTTEQLLTVSEALNVGAGHGSPQGPSAAGRDVAVHREPAWGRKSVTQRSGKPGRPSGISPDAAPVVGGPPLTLSGDDELVRACLAEGGFPTAVETSIGTVWAGPDGMPWAGKRRKRRRA